MLIAVISFRFDRATKSPIPAKRITNIILFMTFEVFKYAARGLYEEHKMTFTLLMALKIDIASHKIRREEFMTLIKGTVIVSASTVLPSAGTAVFLVWEG